jgi:hypothetical protein
MLPVISNQIPHKHTLSETKIRMPNTIPEAPSKSSKKAWVFKKGDTESSINEVSTIFTGYYNSNHQQTSEREIKHFK